MEILVCVKQVPDTAEVKIDPVKHTVIRAGVPNIFNPFDQNALEAALQLKDNQGAKVTVLSMGPPQAKDVLREALAMGADDAYLLTDRKVGGSDTLATGYCLAQAVKKVAELKGIEKFDLVLCGKQAIDGDTAQVGPQIAEHLGLPQVTYLEGIKYEGGNRLVVKKWTEEGYQLLEVETPCVVTVLSSANQPRYMSVRGIVEAYDKQVEVWGFDNISVEESKLGLAGSPTRVFKSFTKGAKSAGKVFELEPAEAADLIVEKLKEKFII